MIPTRDARELYNMIYLVKINWLEVSNADMTMELINIRDFRHITGDRSQSVHPTAHRNPASGSRRHNWRCGYEPNFVNRIEV